MEESQAAGGKEITTARESAEGAGGRIADASLPSLPPISSQRQSTEVSLSGHREGRGRVWTVDLVVLGKAHTQQMGITSVDAIKPRCIFSWVAFQAGGKSVNQ